MKKIIIIAGMLMVISATTLPINDLDDELNIFCSKKEFTYALELLDYYIVAPILAPLFLPNQAAMRQELPRGAVDMDHMMFGRDMLLPQPVLPLPVFYLAVLSRLY